MEPRSAAFAPPTVVFAILDALAVVDEVQHRDLLGDPRRATHVVAMIVADEEIIDFRDAVLRHEGQHAIGGEGVRRCP